MSLWLVIPRDPLIFRDGKPFTAIPGERARSLIFPYPSTLAGAARTLAGSQAASGKFDVQRIPELLKKSICGPLLVEVDNRNEVAEWFFPAPADALLIQSEKTDQARRFWLAPLETKESSSDLSGLKLVGPSMNVKEKPISSPPRYWKQAAFEAWLEKPADGVISPDEIGIQGPRREYRTHVSIYPETQSALPGALFQTSGMEFVALKQASEETLELRKACSLALAVDTKVELREGLDVLGGERRAVRWQKSRSSFPACPAKVKEDMLRWGAGRLVLLTPACFESGFLPDWLAKTYSVEVMAAVLPRYQTISGWDYEKPRPKPTRRLVPAGSVYFLKFNDKERIEAFIKDIWMQTVSDKEQDRRDGFGLAALGTWDGVLREMLVGNQEVKP